MIKKIYITLFLLFCTSVFAIEKETNFLIEDFENAKANGKTIVINSFESWCSTCVAQTKILNQAKKEFKNVIFMSYEHEKNKEIANKLNIEFRTTIVVYKGNKEVSRLIGQTEKKIIYKAIQEGI
jgi:thioredoxin 1